MKKIRHPLKLMRAGMASESGGSVPGVGKGGNWICRVLVVWVLMVVWVSEGVCRETREVGTWELLEGCRRVESSHNDGDSVALKHGGETHVFRVYFVDSLERNPRSRERLIKQAAAFGIPESRLNEARELAEEARRFTQDQMSGEVKVWTKWEMVTPNSNNPSIRAFIEGRDGDLATLLVENGLAIIRTGHHAHAAHPDGRSIDDMLAGLRECERKAKEQKAGAWGVAAKSRR